MKSLSKQDVFSTHLNSLAGNFCDIIHSSIENNACYSNPGADIR